MAVTWNPADKHANITLSNGDLTASVSTAVWASARATMSKASGKWYWEVTIDAGTANFYIGIATSATPVDYRVGEDAYSYGYQHSGLKWHNNSSASYGSTYGAGDVIGVALDLDNGKIWWSKNGVWQASGDPAAGTNEAYSGLSGAFFPAVSLRKDSLITNTANFGASAFAYPAPSEFMGLEAAVLKDLKTEIAADPNTEFLDLLSDIQTSAQLFQDLKTNIEATFTTKFADLKTEIKAGCAARWHYTTEWNPNRFLKTSIEAKKPYEFSFNTQTNTGYSATSVEVELLVPGYSRPLRTLFLDYLKVGNIAEYSFELWWSRGLSGKNPLRNAKIKAEYIDAQYSNGFEVVTCDWLSAKVNDGVFQTVNETPANLGDIPCDSKFDVTLKVNCRDCSLTRGLVFFRLIVTGDFQEAMYGAPVVYRDGSLYHSALQDDYTSKNFVCRLYVVE